jgi:hypothetical protein
VLETADMVTTTHHGRKQRSRDNEAGYVHGREAIDVHGSWQTRSRRVVKHAGSESGSTCMGRTPRRGAAWAFWRAKSFGPRHASNTSEGACRMQYAAGTKGRQRPEDKKGKENDCLGRKAIADGNRVREAGTRRQESSNRRYPYEVC